MSDSGHGPQVLAWVDAVALLESPYTSEDFSPLTQCPLLIVDLSSRGAVAPEALERTRRRLREIPCPTIALCPASVDPEAARLRDAFDLVLAELAPLATIQERVLRTPVAAMALVQLLRHNEGGNLHDALVAESLVYSVLQSGPEFAAWLRERRTGASPDSRREPQVRMRRRRDVLTLTLNRPERHNAFSREMRDQLVEGLQLAVADESIREVVLRGAGPSFCSGGDLGEFGSLPDPATAHAVRSTRNAARLLARCADRVRAEIHGACIGAGVELPAFARRVVAREDATFELPELAMGLVPGAGGTASLPARIGRQRAAFLALSGVRIDAPTALRWGLVDELRIARASRRDG